MTCSTGPMRLAGSESPVTAGRVSLRVIWLRIKSEVRMSIKVVAIVGSYRKGGAIDNAVEAVLEGAREKGAQTRTIYLTDQHLEFCTNCRKCTQPPGAERGQCAQQDDLEAILKEIEAAD